jgi:hypothetical protein
MRELVLLPTLVLATGCASLMPSNQLVECRENASIERQARDRLCEIRPVYSRGWDDCFVRSRELYRTAMNECEGSG